jgi:hypothetical protein
MSNGFFIQPLDRQYGPLGQRSVVDYQLSSNGAQRVSVNPISDQFPSASPLLAQYASGQGQGANMQRVVGRADFDSSLEATIAPNRNRQRLDIDQIGATRKNLQTLRRYKADRFVQVSIGRGEYGRDMITCLKSDTTVIVEISSADPSVPATLDTFTWFEERQSWRLTSADRNHISDEITIDRETLPFQFAIETWAARVLRALLIKSRTQRISGSNHQNPSLGKLASWDWPGGKGPCYPHDDVCSFPIADHRYIGVAVSMCTPVTVDLLQCCQKHDKDLFCGMGSYAMNKADDDLFACIVDEIYKQCTYVWGTLCDIWGSAQINPIVAVLYVILRSAFVFVPYSPPYEGGGIIMDSCVCGGKTPTRKCKCEGKTRLCFKCGGPCYPCSWQRVYNDKGEFIDCTLLKDPTDDKDCCPGTDVKPEYCYPKTTPCYPCYFRWNEQGSCKPVGDPTGQCPCCPGTPGKFDISRCRTAPPQSFKCQ